MNLCGLAAELMFFPLPYDGGKNFDAVDEVPGVTVRPDVLIPNPRLFHRQCFSVSEILDSGASELHEEVEYSIGVKVLGFGAWLPGCESWLIYYL